MPTEGESTLCWLLYQFCTTEESTLFKENAQESNERSQRAALHKLEDSGHACLKCATEKDVIAHFMACWTSHRVCF